MSNTFNLISLFISFFTSIISVILLIDSMFNDNDRFRGPIGKPGPPGLRGNRGDPGLIGNPGYRGNRGNKGEKGNITKKIGLEGKYGNKGDKGVPGTRGKDGLRGNIGKIGKTGKPGNSGPFGDRGDTGPPGKFGPNPSVYFTNKSLEEQITYKSRLDLDNAGFGCNPQEDRNERILKNRKVIREKMLRGINLGMKIDDKQQLFGLCYKMKVGN